MAVPDQMKVLFKDVVDKLPLVGKKPDSVTLKCNVLVADQNGDLREVGLTLYTSSTKNTIEMSTDNHPRGDVDDLDIILNGDQSDIPLRYMKLFQQFDEGGDFGVEEALLKKKGNWEGREGVIGNVEISIENEIQEEEEEEEEEEGEFEPIPLPDTLENYEGGGADFSLEDEDQEMDDAGTFFDDTYDPDGDTIYRYSQIQCTPDGYTFAHKK